MEPEVDAAILRAWLSGESIGREGAMNIPSLAGCLNKIAGTMAAVPITGKFPVMQRLDRGSVGMVLKDAKVPSGNPITIFSSEDIPEELGTDNKNQIALALRGNDTAPQKVVVYVLATAETDYNKAFKYFERKKVDWMCFPSAKKDSQTQKITDWVKAQREAHNRVKAVLPETEADTEGIVNYATKTVTADGKSYTAETFCSRIAGLIAGTGSDQSVTFAVLDDVTACEDLDRKSVEAAIDAGKFVLFDDGEKIKVGRGVTSLTTLTGKQSPWKKIRVVETMDMINNDIVELAEDNYIGKYQNTYSNKCLLLSAIKTYMDEILVNGLIEDYSIEFDVEKIRKYVIENEKIKKEDAEAMSDEEMQKQYTDEKVYFKATVTISDVMEDIYLDITA